TDIQGQPVPVDTHNPIEDVKFVEEEFDQWMKQILQREWHKLTRELESKSGKIIHAITQRFSGLGIDEYDVESVLHGLNLQTKKALDLADKVLSKLDGTGVQKTLNSACFDLLKLIVVFPVEDETKLSNKNGEVLPDARLLPLGSTARDLARVIHEDLSKGFLHAVDAKTKQRVGAEHQLKNGDVLRIVSTLSRG